MADRMLVEELEHRRAEVVVDEGAHRFAAGGERGSLHRPAVLEEAEPGLGSGPGRRGLREARTIVGATRVHAHVHRSILSLGPTAAWRRTRFSCSTDGRRAAAAETSPNRGSGPTGEAY